MKEEGKEPTVIHCQYDNLIADPVGEIERIYKDLGREFTPEFSERIKQYMEESKEKRKNKKIPYSHSLDGTGLSREEIELEFKPVLDVYHLDK